jgi:type II secretory ATPase GspE/PulE/Tfp pilus assembly ATPase PilB-like protein
MGQRIARKICPHCKTAFTPPPEVIEEIRKVLGPLMPATAGGAIKLYKGNGCEACGHSGYLGRVGIFEVMPVTESVSKLILEKKDSFTIEAKAKAEGMITMKQDGYLKVLEGITTIDEILRVAQE